MRLSDERISHITHLMVKGLISAKLIEPLQPEEKLFREVKRTVTTELHEEDEVDALIRRKIQSLSRTVPEGSSEWGVLYRKYLDEEMRRRKKI
jgi:uncharacterized protein